MGKPFKIVEQPSQDTMFIGRGPDGKFVRIESPTTEELKAEAKEKGVTVQQIATLRQAPDSEVVSQNTSTEVGEAAAYEPALKWPPAGPINDADHVPFKNLR